MTNPDDLLSDSAERDYWRDRAKTEQSARREAHEVTALWEQRALTAEAQLQALKQLIVDARRKAPTHGQQEWDWLLGELASLFTVHHQDKP